MCDRDHRLRFVVKAPDHAVALSQLPRCRAERTVAAGVAEVPIP